MLWRSSDGVFAILLGFAFRNDLLGYRIVLGILRVVRLGFLRSRSCGIGNHEYASISDKVEGGADIVCNRKWSHKEERHDKQLTLLIYVCSMNLWTNIFLVNTHSAFNDFEQDFLKRSIVMMPFELRIMFHSPAVIACGGRTIVVFMILILISCHMLTQTF